MSRKFSLPEFLTGIISAETYEHWLRRKAASLLKRDRDRGNKSASGAEYRASIHEAVKASGGVDAYTGETLQWHLISKYNNEESAAGGRHYKQQFSLLPSVDHVSDGLGPAAFVICGWITNDAKNDLAHEEFVELCRKVLRHHESTIPDRRR